MRKRGSPGFLIHVYVLAALFSAAGASAGYGYFVTVDGDVVLEEGKTIDETFYAAGKRVVINGTVKGDLWAIGGTVAVNGTVEGTVFAVCRDLNVSGTAGEGVTAATIRTSVTGTIGDRAPGRLGKVYDVVAAGREVTIGTTVPRDVFILGGRGNILGPVQGGVRAVGRSLLIDAPVDLHVIVWVRQLFLGNQALLKEGLVYTSAYKAEVAQGAQVEGETVRRSPGYWTWFLFPSPAGWFWNLSNYFMQLLVGLAFVLLAPGWLNYAADSIRLTPGACAGWGALLLVAVPFSIAVGFAIYIGIALALILLAVYLVALYLTQIVAGLFIGKAILFREEPTSSRGIGFASIALGLVILNLVALIPWAGPFLILAAVIFGLGALLMSGGYTRAYPSSPGDDLTRAYERR